MIPSGCDDAGLDGPDLTLIVLREALADLDLEFLRVGSIASDFIASVAGGGDPSRALAVARLALRLGELRARVRDLITPGLTRVFIEAEEAWRESREGKPGPGPLDPVS